MNQASIRVSFPLQQALAGVADAAEAWGAEWEVTRESSGRLALPVVLGLRRGVLIGSVVARSLDSTVELTWQLERAHITVARAPVAILSFAAVPLVASLGWPFYPPLLALAPLAAVLGFAAWWLVVSRLQTSGPEEFLALVEEVLDATEPGIGIP